MKITNYRSIQKSVKYGALRAMDTFEHEGAYYMVLAESAYSSGAQGYLVQSVDLTDGLLSSFLPDVEVFPVNAELIITENQQDYVDIKITQSDLDVWIAQVIHRGELIVTASCHNRTDAIADAISQAEVKLAKLGKTLNVSSEDA